MAEIVVVLKSARHDLRPYDGNSPRLGARVFVAENATLIGDVDLGDDCSIWYGAVLRGDVHSIRIGARTNIQDNCVLHVTNGTHPIEIAEEVTIGHGVIAHGCTIERGALIGMGSRVLDGAVVGELALVGAGALVGEGMRDPAAHARRRRSGESEARSADGRDRAAGAVVAELRRVQGEVPE